MNQLSILRFSPSSHRCGRIPTGSIEALHVAAETTCGWHVGQSRVVHHHAVAAKPPSEGADAVHHHLDPLARQTISIAIVEGWNHSLLKRIVEVFSIAFVGQSIVGVARSFADGKSVGSVVGFRPPTIEDAAIESTVENGFLTAGARRFKWPTWIVEPYVNALDHVAADVDVVVFEERNTSGETRVVSQVRDFLNESFAWLVFWVGLARVDDLNWSIGAVQNLANAIQVVEHEIRTFVRCKAATESDGQNVWAEDIASRFDDLIAFTSASALTRNASTDERQQQGS